MRRLAFLLSLLPLLHGCTSTPPASLDTLKSLHVPNAFAGPETNLFCSGQPTPEQFAKLRANGIDRVVSLRPSTESGTGWEEGLAPHSGLEFVRFAVEGPQDLTEQKAREFAAAISGTTPTLVACGSSNRVGALMAMKAKFVDGKTAEEALAIGKACGLTKLEGAVKEALAK